MHPYQPKPERNHKMFEYSNWVKDQNGNVIYVNTERSGNAAVEAEMIAKKMYPVNKGYTHHSSVAEVKRISYSADEGH
jgi:hypothetical protein